MSTPAFRILADGTDVTKAIADRLLSLRISDQAGQQSDSVEIALDDRDSLLPVPRSGTWLKIWLGYSTDGQLPVFMGTYAVDEIDLAMGPRSLTIKATAAQTAPELVKEQRTESWHDKELGEIVQTIANRNGLKPVIKGNLASIKIKHEDQTNESDQSFLTRLADKYKATIKPANGTLVVAPRPGAEGAGSFSIDVEEVSNWRCTLKNRGGYGQVKVKWLDRKVNLEKTTTHGEKGPLPVYEEKQLFRDEDEAKKAAESRLQSLKSGEVRISLTMPGRPELNADGMVTLTGFREFVDGTWVIKQVTHELGSSGYSTSVECGTKGEEDNDWVGSAGANNGRPSSEKARLVAQAAAGARGMNTRGGPDAGRNACVYAVSKVLRSAGVTPPWGNSNYVPDARAALARGGGTLLTGPEAGAIAIMRDNGSPPYAHIGIVQADGSIISNSSSQGSFSWVASPGAYANRYGQTPEYWRLK